MLNLALGTPEQSDGRSTFVTTAGLKGHAIYGPYEMLAPGHYSVEFTIALAPGAVAPSGKLCAVLDVVRNAGTESLARREVTSEDLTGHPTSFTLDFTLDAASRVEYRVWVSGVASLVIDAYQPVVAIGADREAALRQARFPDARAMEIPFFAQNQAMLRGLYEQGIGVSITQGAVALTVDGISLFARTPDDLNFIGELFFERAYNFGSDRPACVIDIGMNIGLASLLFAAKPHVLEVHAFEPFAETYARAIDNLGLNPALASKISAHNAGIADKDWRGVLLVPEGDDSGAMTTVGLSDGRPAEVELRDAATALGPIIASAQARGLDVIVKVDCEGSEFAIFRSLEQAGLLAGIAGFMVEWHAMFPDKTQEDLIAPLRRAGFLVFDRSPPRGNGFFYAARIA